MRFSGSGQTAPFGPMKLYPLLTWAFCVTVSAATPPPSSTTLPPSDISLHPNVRWKGTLPAGPFVHVDASTVLTVEGTETLVSRDQGATWSAQPLFTEPEKYLARVERALIRTRENTLVLAFLNDRERVWSWDKQLGEPGAEVRLPTYVTRSLDGGKSWQTPQKLHDDWSGAIRNMIQTDDGTLVFTTMKILRNPGRHGCLTYRSTDDGVTWQPSTLIDLGGHGHHDGALEPAVVQRQDQRIWMLIRTTMGVFFETYSSDGARHWEKPVPTTIDASTAPPMIVRLQSGRLMLAWNRRTLEGKSDHPLRGGDNQWSARPASNQRQELSIAFSENEGQTWSNPVVIARSEKKDTSYPYLFEASPGEIWVTTMRQTIKVHLREADFVIPPRSTTRL